MVAKPLLASKSLPDNGFGLLSSSLRLLHYQHVPAGNIQPATILNFKNVAVFAHFLHILVLNL